MIQQLNKHKRGAIWVSAVLYIMIIVVVIVLLLQVGMPLLDNMRDKAVFAKTKDMMLALNQHIRDVASEGQGTQRVIPIEIKKGQLMVEDNKIKWEFETSSKVLESRTRAEMGDLIITSNANVDSYETTESYVLENPRIRAELLKTDDLNNTNELIQTLTYLGTNKSLPGQFNFKVGVEDVTTVYSGSTQLSNIGTDLGYATVIASVTSVTGTVNYNYDIILVLESDADFIKVNIENFKVS